MTARLPFFGVFLVEHLTSIFGRKPYLYLIELNEVVATQWVKEKIANVTVL